MKKRILIYTSIIVFFGFPFLVKATTLKEYEDKVAKYTAEIKESKNQIAKNDEEVAQIQSKIQNIKNQIKESEVEVERLQAQIDQSNEEINQKQDEIKRIVKYYQLSSSGNSYIEYILGAQSVTDMIYRLSVSEQLTNYNDKMTKQLNQLIKQNKQKAKDLEQKRVELGKLNSSLYTEQSKIQADTSKIEGMIPSIQGQLALYQQRVRYYKSKGCKSNDVIGVTCDRPVQVYGPGSGGVSGFRFPVVGGKISQNYGNNGHKGVDITRSGGSCGLPIYAVAAGTVYYVGSNLDTLGHAKMILIVHNVNGKLVFSQYAHLSGYNVSLGDSVNTNTVIGYVGNTGISSGCHLHLEMSETYGWGYNNTDYYGVYVPHIINPFRYVPRP